MRSQLPHFLVNMIVAVAILIILCRIMVVIFNYISSARVTISQIVLEGAIVFDSHCR